MRLKWGTVFICICCSGYATATKVDCEVYNYINRGFNKPEKVSSPPGNLTWPPDLSISASKSNLILKVQEIHEDFNLTAFAIPFIENESKCPRSLTENSNLRQHWSTCFMNANTIKSVMPLEIYLEKIFTGCYYFMMTNGTGKNWVLGPAFYSTSYPHHDTKLTLTKDIEIIPGDYETHRRITAELRVPLACIQVSAKIFEYDAEIGNATYDIESMRIGPSQDCWFSKGDIGNRSCKTSNLITSLVLEVTPIWADGNEWISSATWKGLKNGSARYYLSFKPYTAESCKRSEYSDSDLSTWRPIDKYIRIDIGHKNETNIPDKRKHNDVLHDPNFLPILYCLLALIVTVILGYWLWKYSSFRKRKSLWRTTEQLELNLDDERAGRKSDSILLLYVPGCPEFLNIIETLRNSLKKVCRVYDAYGAKEWCKIAELGANRWVEQLLEDGCRVVWVDTPEFRSRVSDKHYIVQDFREEVILFAVHWEKFFRDCTTQYLRHFVLQVEGFEVEDQSDDPLRLVSSLIRYRFPDHLSLLCNQLRQPEKTMTKRKEETRNEASAIRSEDKNVS